MNKPTALPVRAKQNSAQQAKPSPSSLNGKTPTSKTSDVELETQGDDILLSFGGVRRYRDSGSGKKSQQPATESQHSGRPSRRQSWRKPRRDLLHLDTFDLYKARSRNSFIKATASELFTDHDVIKRDIGTLLLRLEQLQHERIEAATQSQQPVEPTVNEKRAAMKLLQDPNLIDRILDDFDACGLAGEETNKLVCYLACVSRRLKNPLALLIQSGSAAGKTTLMDAALSFVPEEDQIRYSAMTGQSLYYMGQTHMKHKILAISEEEGVAQASYALKLLQSDGQLTIAAVGKGNSQWPPGD